MKKQYFWLSVLTMMVVLMIGPRAYAADGQFNQMIQGIHDHRAQMESQLGIDPSLDTYPHATCYYDDLEAHYEQVLIRSDEIDQGLN